MVGSDQKQKRLQKKKPRILQTATASHACGIPVTDGQKQGKR
jgi:hypothetical protein